MQRVIFLSLPVMCLLASNFLLSSTAPTSSLFIENDLDSDSTSETVDEPFTSENKYENSSSIMSSNVTRLTVNSHSFCDNDNQCERKVNGSTCDVTIHMCRCPVNHVKNGNTCEYINRCDAYKYFSNVVFSCVFCLVVSTGSPVSPSYFDDLVAYAILGLIIFGGINTPFKGETLLNRAILLLLSKRLETSR